MQAMRAAPAGTPRVAAPEVQVPALRPPELVSDVVPEAAPAIVPEVVPEPSRGPGIPTGPTFDRAQLEGNSLGAQGRFARGQGRALDRPSRQFDDEIGGVGGSRDDATGIHSTFEAVG